MSKELGKIKNISLGYGGYQDCMLGLSVSLELEGGGVWGFTGTWSCKHVTKEEIADPFSSYQWDEDERAEHYAEVMYKIDDLLNQAKKKKLEDLVNTPIEAEIIGNKLMSWRILEEVL